MDQRTHAPGWPRVSHESGGDRADARATRSAWGRSSERAVALRTGPLRMPAPDVADQLARRNDRSRRSALAGGGNGRTARIAWIRFYRDRCLSTKHAGL